MKTYGWFKQEYDEVKDSFEFKLYEIEMSFTEQILKMMKNRDLSRSQLAEILNVSKAAVSKFLNNGSNITIKRALTIANALGCEIEFKIKERESIAKEKEETCGLDNGKHRKEEVVYKFDFEDVQKNYGKMFLGRNNISITDDYNIDDQDRTNALNAA